MSMNTKIFELAYRRRSVRKYLDDTVPKEMLLRCVEAAGLAPSANNCQPWHFVLVDEPGLVMQTAEATYGPAVRFNKFTTGAKAFAVVLTEKPNLITQIGGALRKVPYELMDLGMAVENFCLQAAQEGIGTCVLGWFNDKNIKKILSIPARNKIALVISIGFPADEDKSGKKRKALETIVSFNRYGRNE